MFLQNKKFNRGLTAMMLSIMLITSFSPIFARRAEAFIFTDWVNFAVNAVTAFANNSIFVKEYALDAIAFSVVNLMVEKMAASTVTWINEGFRGSPAFVTDPARYYQDLGDKIAGDFIFQNPNLDFLCGPISAKIKLALVQNYTQRDRVWQCTLTDAIGNMEDFLDDFDKGGWDKFFEISQKQQNNPIGAYLMAEGELASKINKEVEQKTNELNQGQGFLSYQVCEDLDVNGYNQCRLQGLSVESCKASWTKCKTSTPGSVIQSRLNDALGAGGNRIEVADEINEIVGALLNQLATKSLGGLLSLTKPGSDNSPSYTSQLTSQAKDAKIAKYFQDSGQSVETIINTPVQNPYFCRDNPADPSCLPPPGDPNNPAGSTPSGTTSRAGDCQYIDQNNDVWSIGGPDTQVYCSPSCQSNVFSCLP